MYRPPLLQVPLEPLPVPWPLVLAGVLVIFPLIIVLLLSLLYSRRVKSHVSSHLFKSQTQRCRSPKPIRSPGLAAQFQSYQPSRRALVLQRFMKLPKDTREELVKALPPGLVAAFRKSSREMKERNLMRAREANAAAAAAASTAITLTVTNGAGTIHSIEGIPRGRSSETTIVGSSRRSSAKTLTSNDPLQKGGRRVGGVGKGDVVSRGSNSPPMPLSSSSSSSSLSTDSVDSASFPSSSVASTSAIPIPPTTTSSTPTTRSSSPPKSSKKRPFLLATLTSLNLKDQATSILRRAQSKRPHQLHSHNKSNEGSRKDGDEALMDDAVEGEYLELEGGEAEHPLVAAFLQSLEEDLEEEEGSLSDEDDEKRGGVGSSTSSLASTSSVRSTASSRSKRKGKENERKEREREREIFSSYKIIYSKTPHNHLDGIKSAVKKPIPTTSDIVASSSSLSTLSPECFPETTTTSSISTFSSSSSSSPSPSTLSLVSSPNLEPQTMERRRVRWGNLEYSPAPPPTRAGLRRPSLSSSNNPASQQRTSSSPGGSSLSLSNSPPSSSSLPPSTAAGMNSSRTRRGSVSISPRSRANNLISPPTRSSLLRPPPSSSSKPKTITAAEAIPRRSLPISERDRGVARKRRSGSPILPRGVSIIDGEDNVEEVIEDENEEVDKGDDEDGEELVGCGSGSGSSSSDERKSSRSSNSRVSGKGKGKATNKSRGKRWPVPLGSASSKQGAGTSSMDLASGSNVSSKVDLGANSVPPGDLLSKTSTEVSESPPTELSFSVPAQPLLSSSSSQSVVERLEEMVADDEVRSNSVEQVDPNNGSKQREKLSSSFDDEMTTLATTITTGQKELHFDHRNEDEEDVAEAPGADGGDDWSTDPSAPNSPCSSPGLTGHHGKGLGFGASGLSMTKTVTIPIPPEDPSQKGEGSNIERIDQDTKMVVPEVRLMDAEGFPVGDEIEPGVVVDDDDEEDFEDEAAEEDHEKLSTRRTSGPSSFRRHRRRSSKSDSKSLPLVSSPSSTSNTAEVGFTSSTAGIGGSGKAEGRTKGTGSGKSGRRRAGSGSVGRKA